MIRKVIIVLLTLGAVVTASIAFAGYAGPVSLEYYAAERFVWCNLFAANGRLRLRCESDVASFSKEMGPGVYGGKLGNDSLFLTLPWGLHRTAVSYWRLSGRVRYHSIPAWASGIIAVMFAAYPIAAFIRGPLRRRRRQRKGLCLRCGYDLTGNVSGVCSECGTSVPE